VRDAISDKDTCKLCDVGSYSLVGGDDAACLSDGPHSDGCGKDCGCLGGTTVVAKPGFWRGPPYYRTWVGAGYAVDSAECARQRNGSVFTAVELGSNRTEALCLVTSAAPAGARRAPDASGVRVYRCPNEAACVVRAAALRTGTGQLKYPACAVGYHGALCSLCDDGYAWSEGHVCTECEAGSGTARLRASSPSACCCTSW
jgi:hypothetical protein